MSIARDIRKADQLAEFFCDEERQHRKPKELLIFIYRVFQANRFFSFKSISAHLKNYPKGLLHGRVEYPLGLDGSDEEIEFAEAFIAKAERDRKQQAIQDTEFALSHFPLKTIERLFLRDDLAVAILPRFFFAHHDKTKDLWDEISLYYKYVDDFREAYMASKSKFLLEKAAPEKPATIRKVVKI